MTKNRRTWRRRLVAPLALTAGLATATAGVHCTTREAPKKPDAGQAFDPFPDVFYRTPEEVKLDEKVPENVWRKQGVVEGTDKAYILKRIDSMMEKAQRIDEVASYVKIEELYEALQNRIEILETQKAKEHFPGELQTWQHVLSGGAEVLINPENGQISGPTGIKGALEAYEKQGRTAITPILVTLRQRIENEGKINQGEVRQLNTILEHISSGVSPWAEKAEILLPERTAVKVRAADEGVLPIMGVGAMLFNCNEPPIAEWVKQQKGIGK